MDDEETARYWNDAAEGFDDEPDHGLTDPAVRAAWRALLTSTLPPPPATVADLGCGTGTLSVLLAEQGYVVHGVDRSDRMLERAGRKAEVVDPRPTFHVGDAAAPPLEPAAFDVVLCRHVLWALPDPAAALRRWIELLAPGGRLVLVEGRWDTGVGLRAAAVEALIAPLTRIHKIRPLTDRALWGKDIADERFLLVAQP